MGKVSASQVSMQFQKQMKDISSQIARLLRMLFLEIGQQIFQRFLKRFFSQRSRQPLCQRSEQEVDLGFSDIVLGLCFYQEMVFQQIGRAGFDFIRESIEVAIGDIFQDDILKGKSS